MDEINVIKNFGLSVKDIEYICGSLMLLSYMPVGHIFVEDYSTDYNVKLYTRLSAYKN